MNNFPLLDISHLSVAFRRAGRWVEVVRDVGITIESQTSYGLIGESGCGKSTLATAILGYLPKNGQITSGSVVFKGEDLVPLTEKQLMAIRGHQIAVVYQNPFSALNPSMRIRDQLMECVAPNSVSSRDEALHRCLNWLRKLQMPDPDRVASLYPHDLSGGMLQRVVIAMAMLLGAEMLVLDEPTTALDTTVQAEILDILLELKQRESITLLFISHDLASVAQICDRIGVMYAGELVEEGELGDILNTPKHPYTASLLQCIPRVGQNGSELKSIPGFLPAPEQLPSGCIFESRCAIRQSQCRQSRPEFTFYDDIHRVRCFYPDRVGTALQPVESDVTHRRKTQLGRQQETLLTAEDVNISFDGTQVLKDVSFSVFRGETLALVGESGGGKSTIALSIAGLLSSQTGRLTFGGRELNYRLDRRTREQKRQLQMVFQSPDSTLNPTRRVNYILGRALTLLAQNAAEATYRDVGSLLEAVSLPDTVARSLSRHLSGGQRQRVAIARAFSGQPKLVILDEPTSALDVSAQATIINLLTSLQQHTGCAYLFITHDLAIVQYMAHRAAVLYLGVMVEIGSVHEVFDFPVHPYTEALLSAIPTLHERKIESRIRLQGENPGPRYRPGGCPFHTRCSYAFPKCKVEFPVWQQPSVGHQYLCWIEPAELQRLQKQRARNTAEVGDASTITQI